MVDLPPRGGVYFEKNTKRVIWMEYINTPSVLPRNMQHHTFFCERYGHELGYNIYLPDGYETCTERYPVVYHLHGWTGNESSEIAAMSPVCCARNAITVFPNSSPVIEDRENLPVEDMLIHELIPLIDSLYRTGSRGLSGFSMGGGAAMYYALKYPELFSSVTAYAGTYHHYLAYTDFRTVGAPVEKAAEFYQELLAMEAPAGKDILPLAKRQADALRSMRISMRVGAKDPLYCENALFHMHLEQLGVAHEYQTFDGAEHHLPSIL